MTAYFIRSSALLLGSAIAISLASGISNAQTAQTSSESRLDRAVQQNEVNAVKEVAFELYRNGKINNAEESAYKAILAAQNGDPATRIRLAEDFVSKFLMSHYLPWVYGVLTSSYFATGDTEKMFAAGAKAVQLDPGNADVMSLLAMAIPRRVKATAPDAAERLRTAEVYARRVIEIIPAMTKPATIDDAEFEKIKNDRLALAHSGLGLIDIQHSKYEDARIEFTQALQLASTPDPVDYYLLGTADVKAGYFNGAIAAYEKCAASGPMMAECRDYGDFIKKKDWTTAAIKD